MVRFTFAGCIFLPILSAKNPAAAQTAPSISEAPPSLPDGFSIASIRLRENGPEYRYAVFIPHDYSKAPDRKWPVILFLHGSGECGTDGIKQTTVGLPVHVARRSRTFPFIVVMPQAHSLWFNGEDEQAAWRMLESVLVTYRTDQDRVYITGLSMGGFATWNFISKQPDIFAAAVPVCGVGDPRTVVNARSMPIWAFHGALDQNVPVAGSREAVAALKLVGGKPEYTEYADGDHFIWDRVYGGQRIYDWLLRKKRPAPPKRIEYRMMQPYARVWWLALRSVESPTQQPLASAVIGDDRTVTLNTQAIEAWALSSNAEPLPPSEPIKVIWNGKVMFDGKFPGVLQLNPRPTSQPADSTSATPSETPVRRPNDH